MRIQWVNPPRDLGEILGPLPDDVRVLARAGKHLDFIHGFVTRKSQLAALLQRGRRYLAKDGMLWISWPKKASGMVSEVTETDVRSAGLEAGLVDVKICAVDDTWSGLKFVYRLKDR